MYAMPGQDAEKWHTGRLSKCEGSRCYQRNHRTGASLPAGACQKQGHPRDLEPAGIAHLFWHLLYSLHLTVGAEKGFLADTTRQVCKEGVLYA